MITKTLKIKYRIICNNAEDRLIYLLDVDPKLVFGVLYNFDDVIYECVHEEDFEIKNNTAYKDYLVEIWE